MKIGRRVRNILVSVDQLAWSLVTLGAAFPDETISSAAYRYEQQGNVLGKYSRMFIDLLFFFEPDHCRLAFEAELQREQAPKDIDDRYKF